jgi:hypothetical protein
MTEKTIIERAARALLARQEPSLLWDDLMEFDQEAYKADARAVLTAIQEPSEAMIGACDYVAGTACPKNFLKIRWQAMIDAALAE